ncbi:MAG: WG repeat-containing protein [Sporocytophaga sp.]|uniref:WG repeat-containing protein n=1 Tax=Sporocytophaga sp. TaxID=2231183 RepID=UPI001B2C8C6A|nr:WG repeat-containing protein [Sporocytophaga sp.]MBO9700370.1 WG repeat-containing protein [Sporocytophaga sp.]
MKFLFTFLALLHLLINTSFAQKQDDCLKADLIPILVKGKFGFCDKEGRIVIAPKFDDAEPFVINMLYYIFNKDKIYGKADFATVKLKDKYYRIDKSGKPVFKFNPDEIEQVREYKEPVYKEFEEGDKKGIKLDSTVIINCLYDEIYHPDFYYKEFPFRVKKDNKYGIIDANGKLLIPVIYDDIYYNYRDYISAGLLKVRQENKVFYIDYCGNQYVK